jgi:hypothetical protein
VTSPSAKRAADNSLTLPNLRAWSDVTFLIWKNECDTKGAAISSLNAVIVDDVTNDKTKSIVNEVFPGFLNTGSQPPISVGRNDEEFNIILGTPNGQGIGFMLAQHRDAFQGKTIKDIRLIKQGRTTRFDIVFDLQ